MDEEGVDNFEGVFYKTTAQVTQLPGGRKTPIFAILTVAGDKLL